MMSSGSGYHAAQFGSVCELKAQMMSSYTRTKLTSVGQLGGGAAIMKPFMDQTHIPTNQCRMHTTAILSGIAWALETRLRRDKGKFAAKTMELEIGSRFLVDWLNSKPAAGSSTANAVAPPGSTLALKAHLTKFQTLLAFVKDVYLPIVEGKVKNVEKTVTRTASDAHASTPGAADKEVGAKLFPAPFLSEWSRKQLARELKACMVPALEKIVAILSSSNAGKVLFTAVTDCGRHFNRECSGQLPPGRVAKIRQKAVEKGAFVLYRCAHEDSSDLIEVRTQIGETTKDRYPWFLSNFWSPEYLASADPGLFWCLVRHASNLHVPAEEMEQPAGMFAPPKRSAAQPSCQAPLDSDEDEDSQRDQASLTDAAKANFASNEAQLDDYLRALSPQSTTANANGGGAPGAAGTAASSCFSSCTWVSLRSGILAATLSRYVFFTGGAQKKHSILWVNPEFPDEKCTKVAVAVVNECASKRFFRRLMEEGQQLPPSFAVAVVEREEEMQGQYGKQMQSQMEQTQKLNELTKKNPALAKLFDAAKSGKDFERIVAQNPSLLPVVQQLLGNLGMDGGNGSGTTNAATSNATSSTTSASASSTLLPDEDALARGSRTAVKLTGQKRVCWQCQNVELDRDKRSWVTCGICNTATYCASTHMKMHKAEHAEECAYFCNAGAAKEPDEEARLDFTDAEKKKLDQMVPVMVLPQNDAVKPYVRFLPKDPVLARERIKKLLGNCSYLAEGNSFRGFQPDNGATPGVNNEESRPGKRYYNTEFWLVQEDFCNAHLKGAEVVIQGLTGNTGLNQRRGVLTGEYKSPTGHPGKAKDRYGVRLLKRGSENNGKLEKNLEPETKLIAGANLALTDQNFVRKKAKQNLQPQNARASALLTALNSIPVPPEFGARARAAPITNFMHVGDHRESKENEGRSRPTPPTTGHHSYSKRLLPCDRALYDSLCGIFNMMMIPGTSRVAMASVMKNDAEGEGMMAAAMAPLMQPANNSPPPASATRTRGGATSSGTTNNRSDHNDPLFSPSDIQQLGEDVRAMRISGPAPPEEEPEGIVGSRVRIVDFDESPELNGRSGRIVKVIQPADTAPSGTGSGAGAVPDLVQMLSASEKKYEVRMDANGTHDQRCHDHEGQATSGGSGRGAGEKIGRAAWQSALPDDTVAQHLPDLKRKSGGTGRSGVSTRFGYLLKTWGERGVYDESSRQLDLRKLLADFRHDFTGASAGVEGDSVCDDFDWVVYGSAEGANAVSDVVEGFRENTKKRFLMWYEGCIPDKCEAAPAGGATSVVMDLKQLERRVLVGQASAAKIWALIDKETRKDAQKQVVEEDARAEPLAAAGRAGQSIVDTSTSTTFAVIVRLAAQIRSRISISSLISRSRMLLSTRFYRGLIPLVLALSWTPPEALGVGVAQFASPTTAEGVVDPDKQKVGKIEAAANSKRSKKDSRRVPLLKIRPFDAETDGPQGVVQKTFACTKSALCGGVVAAKVAYSLLSFYNLPGKLRTACARRRSGKAEDGKQTLRRPQPPLPATERLSDKGVKQWNAEYSGLYDDLTGSGKGHLWKKRGAEHIVLRKVIPKNDNEQEHRYEIIKNKPHEMEEQGGSEATSSRSSHQVDDVDVDVVAWLVVAGSSSRFETEQGDRPRSASWHLAADGNEVIELPEGHPGVRPLSLFVSHHGIRDVPVFGTICNSWGGIFVNRDCAESRKACACGILEHCEKWASRNRFGTDEHVDDLDPMIVFPEGGLSNGEFLTDFKSGALSHPTAPVRPVLLKYLGEERGNGFAVHAGDHAGNMAEAGYYATPAQLAAALEGMGKEAQSQNCEHLVDEEGDAAGIRQLREKLRKSAVTMDQKELQKVSTLQWFARHVFPGSFSGRRKIVMRFANVQRPDLPRSSLNNCEGVASSPIASQEQASFAERVQELARQEYLTLPKSVASLEGATSERTEGARNFLPASHGPASGSLISKKHN
eukprot:g16657.t1